MLKLKLQYFGHLMQRTDSLEKTLMLRKIEVRGRRGWQRMRWVGWHHQLNGHEFEQALRVGDGQGSLACCSPWGGKESDTTKWLNWTDLNIRMKIRAILLFEFTMNCKAVETTHNISKHTMQGWFKKFAKDMRALKMRSVVPSHWKLTITSESYHRSWSSYNYTRSCSITQHWPFYGDWHLKQIGKVKNLNEWVPHDLTQNQKELSFWSVIFS